MAPSLSKASLLSLEEDVVEATILGAIDDTVSEPPKKDLRFKTVENSPPTETDSLEVTKLAQYVQSSGSNFAPLHTSDMIELEVQKHVTHLACCVHSTYQSIV